MRLSKGNTRESTEHKFKINDDAKKWTDSKVSDIDHNYFVLYIVLQE